MQQSHMVIHTSRFDPCTSSAQERHDAAVDDLSSRGPIEFTFDDGMDQFGMEFIPALALIPGDPLGATLCTKFISSFSQPLRSNRTFILQIQIHNLMRVNQKSIPMSGYLLTTTTTTDLAPRPSTAHVKMNGLVRTTN